MSGRIYSRHVVAPLATLGMIALAGCGSYGGGGGGGAPISGASSPISATLAWSDASGPVASYRVFTERNSGGFSFEEDVPSARATISGEPGDRMRIQVAALDAQGMMGPRSQASAEILFTEDGAVAGATAASSSVPGAAATRSAGSATSAEDTADAADTSDSGESDAPLELAKDAAAQLLWEADAPSTALQLTSLWDGSLRTELSFQRPGDDWWVVGKDDFDGDGLVDVLWESEVGMLAFSSLATLVETAPVAPLALLGELSADEALVSTGDYDGDGLADLLVKDEATGERSVWLMNGVGAPDIESLSGLGVAASDVAASGDFDGDGRADLLWRAADGSLSIRFMDGAVAVAGLDVSSGSALEAIGTGDVDGDGDDDIVYRDASTGAVDVLLMQAGQEATPWSRSLAVGPGWELAGLGDVDGDGLADLLWASASSWIVGFQSPEDTGSDYLALDPGGSNWLLVAFTP